MPMAPLPEPHRLILTLCTEDHVGLWFIIPHIKDFYRGDDAKSIRARTLEVLQNLLDSGLIQAGHPTPDNAGFVAWDISPDATIARITREWGALAHEPSIGDIVWFTATPAGKKARSNNLPL